MALPKALVESVCNGQVILFLGAGASLGASQSRNETPPIGQRLADILAERFLGADYIGRPLAQISELVINETDIITVQGFIASIFDEFYPADFHKLIPKFIWHAIVTTNYDLIIERAYDEAPRILQTPVVFKKNGERVDEKLKTQDSVPYIKLHGCITDIVDPNVPLILTPDQYVTHKQGRSRLFARFLEYGYEYPILFIGSSLSDIDIRGILMELSTTGDARPRYYIVTPNMSPAEVRLWESHRFTHIHSSFKDFLIELDGSIPSSFRVLAATKEKPVHPIFDRFKESSAIRPTESLINLLSREVEYIHKDFTSIKADAKAFYKGYFLDWSPIIDGLDVRRSLTDDIISEVFLVSEEEKNENAQFYLIKGHAGSGKSVIMKRLAWDAAVSFGKICLSLKSSSNLEYEPLLELSRMCKERIYLFIDPVSDFVDLIGDIIKRARKDKVQITIIGAERFNEWNSCTEYLAPFVTESYEVRYLNRKEIEALIHLLDVNKSLGYLEGIPFEKQVQELSQRAGRQILVALHEATLGKPFSDIVFDEYQSISSIRAKSLYLTVCILHRLGVPVRAGLISRVHGIPFSEFKERLFSPLEFIVFASENPNIRDFEYRSRHQLIAEMVFARVLQNDQDKFDEYIKVIDALDIDYKSDRDAFNSLMKARQLLSLFRNPQMVRQLYEAAKQMDSNNPILLQQEAIFEMYSTDGSLDKASSLLQTAHNMAAWSQQISHSLSVLALRKAAKAKSDLEKNKYRQESRSIAEGLTKRGIVSAYPFQTLIQIDIDELTELIEGEDESSIQRKVKELEEKITRGLQIFPDDEFILASEAKFCSLINQNEKALKALEKAFAINKRSPYIASRLSRMYESQKNITKGIEVLKECLDSNPSEKSINFKLAMLLQDIPDTNKAEIKLHLKRSFTDGDNNFLAQFWYARCLYIDGDFEEALKIFAVLRGANIDERVKQTLRGMIYENGVPVVFTGTIRKIEASYGFIVRDRYQDSVFIHKDACDEEVWDSLHLQKRVKFFLTFNYKGPQADNLTLENITN
jgi:tetratricopeptide (TPR) repeat protein/cold shock CspA family protein